MKNFKRILAIFLTVVVLAIILCGCSEADRVNQNLNLAADNFNITRQITVFNTRTDTVLFQMTGLMSLSNNGADELVVTVETGPNTYKKHFIYLGHDVTYIMEDVTGAYADKYFYELNVNPLLWAPFVKPVYQD